MALRKLQLGCGISEILWLGMVYKSVIGVHQQPINGFWMGHNWSEPELLRKANFVIDYRQLNIDY